MGKATVESGLTLKADFWARPPLREHAQEFVFALRRWQNAARRGEPMPVASGFMALEWHVTATGEPAGNIRWGALAAEGDRITRLLLGFRCRVAGGDWQDHRQEVSLSWVSPKGKALPAPVFECPYCGRRGRYLYTAGHSSRPGVPPGVFCCRDCGGLCYRAQLEYRSAAVKNFAALMDYAARAAVMARDLRAGKDVSPKRLERLQVMSARARAFVAHSKFTPPETPETEARRVWDVLPPPLYGPKKRRGRPSPKRARWVKRECARLLRESRPKRPAGHPKVRRAYSVAGRAQSGCAGRVGPQEGYCVACRGPREIVRASAFTASNGRAGIKGTCAGCGRGLCRMGGQNQNIGNTQNIAEKQVNRGNSPVDTES